MKRTWKAIASLVMMLVMLLGIGVTAYADDSTITYRSRKFSFKPGSEYTETDLFDGFKSVMPGDTLTETITFINRSTACDAVRLYIRAVPHDEEKNPLSENVAAAGETVASMSDFLSQLHMKVYDGKTLIYESSPDQPAQLTTNKYLGSFSYGEKAVLTVELEVPIDLGNDYAYRVGEVDWVFTVEELDAQGNPKTGDTSNLTLWVCVMVVCLAAIAVVAFLILKKKKAK